MKAISVLFVAAQVSSPPPDCSIPFSFTASGKSSAPYAQASATGTFVPWVNVMETGSFFSSGLIAGTVVGWRPLRRLRVLWRTQSSYQARQWPPCRVGPQQRPSKLRRVHLSRSCPPTGFTAETSWKLTEGKSMAHSCPECGQCCYCGSDIDNCLFDFDDDVDA